MSHNIDKRSALIEAATVLIHRQGFNLTTLANIAEEARVPLGNVYYYFKTKESIGAAVIEVLSKKQLGRFLQWDKFDCPRKRLLAFIAYEVGQAEKTMRSGCEIGSLCQELSKQNGALTDASADLLQQQLVWVTAQFNAIGLKKAHEQAVHFIASLQGIALLVNTFGDANLFAAQTKLLSDSLDNLVLSDGLDELTDAA